MSNVFADQAMFMEACEQTTDRWNPEQLNLYLKLIEEEYKELCSAVEAKNKVEMLDALLDLLVVTLGAGLSAGFDMREGWDRVLLSNLRKIDPETGKVRRREDGKILKPAGWRAPKLEDLVA